ncbi:DUF4350 domain-containing protein [Agriterribacter sp.]|uniref:DUF4350 domain-containing protein n=1 Tax=Agriterribacter sp. TaxID=2821509 RepID=UPI002B99F5D4|nr:DUF4350 domain-containing protein [Agriterribacter sp.]HRP58561.1 hypothetical protein [Agriterribacter sp.]
MKKAIPYLLGGLLLLLLLALLAGENKKNFDHRITLNKNDKIPYGSYVAYQGLSHIFPYAKITINKKAPGYWDETVLDYSAGKQAIIIICKDFNASSDELTELFHFVGRGNDVLISSYDLSNDAQHFFHLNLSYADAGFPVFDNYSELDTLHLGLTHPPFSKTDNQYGYPGRKFNSWFNTVDSSMSYVLGTSGGNRASYIRLRVGDGSFFIHTAPLAFSNYFLLHKQNMGYYSQLLSAMDAGASTVAWDEYYLHKPQNSGQKKPSPLRVLMEQPAFRMALLTALAGLFLFVLLGVKRNQRMIPVIAAPKNDSLDFVKTIGRLYFQKRDNKNLCRKMIVYFTEHVHSHFNMTSGNMDADFVTRLSQKSGCDAHTIQAVTDYIRFIQEAPAVHDRQVAEFYQLLERFYKTT